MKKALPIVILSVLAIAGIGIFVVGRKKKSTQDNAADQAAKEAADAQAEVVRLEREQAKKEQIEAARKRAAEKKKEAELKAQLAEEKDNADKMGMSVTIYRAWLEEVAYARGAINANASFGSFKKAELNSILDREANVRGFAEQMKPKAIANGRRLGAQIYMDVIWLYEHKSV